MAKKPSDRVRRSEQAFRERGGAMKVVRLNPDDQEAISQLRSNLALPNDTAAIRYALKAGSAQALQSTRRTSMKVIAVANQKGGSGKTTTSTTISDALMTRGYRVLLIDTDAQASTQKWRENRADEQPNMQSPDVIGMARVFTAEEIQSIGGSYDLVVIDVGGGSEKGPIAINTAAIRAADLVILPTQPSYYEVHGSVRTIEMIKERQDVNNGRPLARVLISGVRANAKLTRETEETFKDLEMPRFETMIKLREEHRHLPIRGLTGVSGSKAVREEINQLTDEILKLLKLSANKGG